MIVLDATVLVYAKGEDHALRAPCRKLIEQIASREIEATTTTEVVQEFAHVRARHRDRGDAAALARDYADLLSPLLIVDGGALDAGLSLFAEARQIGAFDAVLAATAIEAGATHLISADRAFSQLKDLDHVYPDERGIAALLDKP